MLTRYVFAGCVCVVALGLSGCSAEPESALSSPTVALSSPTSESSDSTSPPVTQLELPKPTAGMANNDAQGATEAADYFGKMITYVMATQQTDLLNTFVVEDCPECEGSRDTLVFLKEKSLRYSGFSVEYILKETPAELSDSLWFAKAKLAVSEYEILDSEDQVVKTEAADSRTGTFAVEYTENGWKLLGLLPEK